ncbi:hypothetical protein Tco_0672504 [Tanacetum coccineum]
MLAQPTEDEGAVSERPTEIQPTPSPTHLSEDQSEPQPDPFLRHSSSNLIPDSILEGSGGNHGGSDQAAKEEGPTCYQPSQSLDKQSFNEEKIRKEEKDEVSFDDLDDAMGYMETKDAHDEGTVKDSEETRSYNVPLMSKHVWNLVSKKDSVWVKWINFYRLVDKRSCERNFWDVPVLNDACWGWRKILQCRDVLRSHDVSRIGLSLNYKVADLIQNGEWVWPECWAGVAGHFSIKVVWANLIPSKPVVPWLVIGAVTYVLWQERNLRFFQGKSRNVETVCGIVMELVRFRLLSLKIKYSKQALEATEIWKFKVLQRNDSKPSIGCHLLLVVKSIRKGQHGFSPSRIVDCCRGNAEGEIRSASDPFNEVMDCFEYLKHGHIFSMQDMKFSWFLCSLIDISDVCIGAFIILLDDLPQQHKQRKNDRTMLQHPEIMLEKHEYKQLPQHSHVIEKVTDGGCDVGKEVAKGVGNCFRRV